MGQLHDRIAQDLLLCNLSLATRWRALRGVVILCD
jgi:hypothetical protein